MIDKGCEAAKEQIEQTSCGMKNTIDSTIIGPCHKNKYISPAIQQCDFSDEMGQWSFPFRNFMESDVFRKIIAAIIDRNPVACKQLLREV